MFKLLGITLIFAACCYLGEVSGRRLFRRRNFLCEMTVFTAALKSRIRFTGDELDLAVRESAAQPLVKKYFGSINVVSGEEDFSGIWGEMSAEAAAGCSLTVDDLNLLLGLGKGLGTTDTEGQMDHLSMYEEFFRQSYETAKEEAKTKGRLYRICGVCAGAAAALLLL